MKSQQAVLPIATVLGSMMLTACGWVDSTGSQVVPRTEIFLDDSPAGSTIIVSENTVAAITVDRTSSADVIHTFSWSSEPTNEGNLPSCLAQNGFDIAYTAETLQEACTNPAQCSLMIETVDVTENIAKYELFVPQLKASLGRQYQLTVSDSTGVVDTLNYDFCFIAINEAPVAGADTFVVREGVREEFTAGQSNLLFNDTDDIDARNVALEVDTTPVRSPEFAEFFDLRDDGSFTYESRLTNLLSDRLDSFEYSVSDGTHSSTALVTLRIVANNQAPELIDAIPVLDVLVGEQFAENLSLYFSDPEQGSLSYSFSDDFAFPAGSGISLSSDGVLSGIPTEADVGSYQLSLITSDGGREISTLITLIVNAAPIVPLNSEPLYTPNTVRDQWMYLGEEMIPVSPEFTDPDGDVLTYSMAEGSVLPAGISIDPTTGVVSGTSLVRYRGSDLVVQATDPDGATGFSDPFYLIVR